MNNISITENGAVGFKSSGSALVDLNFKACSFRDKPHELKKLFSKAYKENPVLALKWLFYARDIRGGMGERSIVRHAMAWLQWKHPDVMNAVMELLPEYGRWDDVIYLMEFSTTREKAFDLVYKQLKEDMGRILDGKSVSLLGKWLPSITSSNQKTRMRAYDIAKRLGFSPKLYRKACSILRERIEVVERLMSTNKWGDIDYGKVTSQANLKYSNAFKRRDGERYAEFISQVNNGNASINAKALMPYQIVHKYTSQNDSKISEVAEIEALWNNLPKIESTGLVILDGSFSMLGRVGKTKVTRRDIASSLAIYMSQNCKGALKDKFITFGMIPRFVDIGDCSSLAECLNTALKNTDCSNTDIFLTYKGLADMAVRYNLSQEELPDRLIIVSDMEFDAGCCGVYGVNSTRYKQADKALFDSIKDYWDKAGYKMPKLVFWNIMSRTNTIQVTENELGVILMSGFSANAVNMAMSGEIDPYKAIVGVLSDPRYNLVEECLNALK